MATAKAPRSSQGAIRRVRERARSEGVEAALDAALRICRNDNARAADQLDAANLILRLSGAYEGAGDDQEEKPLHEMTRAELGAAAARARDYLDDLENPLEDDDNVGDPDVFD